MFRAKVVEKNESYILYRMYDSDAFKTFEIIKYKGAKEPVSTSIYAEK